ncbi:hypothetical protein C922_04389 [Plasmodium inui San Antonio 1]|uniref:FZ domain-containing protein n=1 Tax=Plasmodium inui San Antonio 1 TaxID=1237626 RepID=W7A0V5_9APIC|nr:hypothetical protein C922_04389 [Plasmodium inui San Antonio 1]EUD65260.1 hypothetical protein C922_04389 [Plasmodium inui San Antonio 1]
MKCAIWFGVLLCLVGWGAAVAGDAVEDAVGEAPNNTANEAIGDAPNNAASNAEALANFANPNELYDLLAEEAKGGTQDGDRLKGSAEDGGRLEATPKLKRRWGKTPKGLSKVARVDKDTFLTLYESALSHFDVDGYGAFIQEVIGQRRGSDQPGEAKRWRRTTRQSHPHCDKGVSGGVRSGLSSRVGADGRTIPRGATKGRQTKEAGGGAATNVEYPGGAIRSAYGNNLSKWMKDSLQDIESPASIKEPGLANMLIQSLTMVKGLIQSVASSVVDIVPPLIPPPVWINRPLPCLPMVTGKNCLGSILYPITAAEFVTADITDSTMNGIISSFPAKYASKVGKTSDAQYRLCAMAYLGMYCASLFPICWMPIGLKVAETMSVCFPQCLATLIACPGFWIDDIEGPCSNASVPPFCSFSVFVNQKIVPPQLTSYDDSHDYPATCPTPDYEYDSPEELYQHDDTHVESVYTKKRDAYSNATLPVYPDLVAKLYPDELTGEELDTCRCVEMSHLCRRHFAIPVLRKRHPVFYPSHEEPVKLSPRQSRCCRVCKPIWRVLFPRR